MLGRSLLLLVAALIVIAGVATLVAPRDLREGHGGATLAQVTAVPKPPVTPPAVTVNLPSPTPTVVAQGTPVTLTFRGTTSDELDVAALGTSAPVDPGQPTALQVIADAPGKHPVTLKYSGARVGTLEVRANPGVGGTP